MAFLETLDNFDGITAVGAWFTTLLIETICGALRTSGFATITREVPSGVPSVIESDLTIGTKDAASLAAASWTISRSSNGMF